MTKEKTTAKKEKTKMKWRDIVPRLMFKASERSAVC